MVDSRNGEAYDFSLFESSSAAPAVPQQSPRRAPKAPPRPVVVPERRKSREERRAEAVAHRRKVVKVFVISMMLFSMLFSSIYVRVQLSELSAETNVKQKELSTLKSEHTRLKMQFDALVSLDKVELYAKTKLGMVKRERYQITYLDIDSGDEVLLLDSDE